MKLMRITKDIKNQALLLLGSIPLFVLNLWIIQRSNNIKFEFQNFTKGKLLVLSLVYIGWMIINIYTLLKAKWFSFWSTLVCAGILIAVNTNIVILRNNYALAFYVLFILIVSSLYLISNYQTLSQPYFNSKRRWFEGLPKFFPVIKAEISDGFNINEAKISNLNEDGCYVYTNEPVKKVENVRLYYGKRECVLPVDWIISSDHGQGIGLKFNIKNADNKKEVSEFIDKARSLGYVE